MSEIIMTKGLPGSGKSSWAQDQVKKNSDITRVNKDDLRAMMHNSRWSSANEREVLQARDNLVMEALKVGKRVIVDDTNFHPKHEARLREIAEAHGAKFSIKEFDVPVSTALERNASRKDKEPVPRKVIIQMWEQYIKPTITYDESLPSAVIVDIDGTLAHMNGRGPFDWSRVGEDTVDDLVMTAVKAFYRRGFYIVVMSGRDGSCYPETLNWLNSNDVFYHFLHMREEGDNRKDSIVKRELFERFILGTFYPVLVIDDRQQVVDMWRYDLGLKVWQVAPGEF